VFGRVLTRIQARERQRRKRSARRGLCQPRGTQVCVRERAKAGFVPMRQESGFDLSFLSRLLTFVMGRR